MLYYAEIGVKLHEPLKCGQNEQDEDLVAAGYYVTFIINANSNTEAVSVLENEALIPDPPKDRWPTRMPGVVSEIEIRHCSQKEIEDAEIELSTKDENGIVYRTGFVLYQDESYERKWWQIWKKKPGGYVLDE